MIAYVEDSGNGYYTVKRNHRSKYYVCECPQDENGNYIVDMDILDVVNLLDDNENVIGKQAVVNSSKKDSKDESVSAAALEHEWNVFRAIRDKKLLECDWTQGNDAKPTLSASQIVAWANYRQQLRDLPDNTQDPSNPSWPEKPS